MAARNPELPHRVHVCFCLCPHVSLCLRLSVFEDHLFACPCVFVFACWRLRVSCACDAPNGCCENAFAALEAEAVVRLSASATTRIQDVSAV